MQALKIFALIPNAARAAGANRLGEVRKMSDQRLPGIRNLNRKCLVKLDEKLPDWALFRDFDGSAKLE